MNLQKDIIKQVVLSKGYKWFTDRPNLIGIRSSMNVPNVFNDILCLIVDGGPEKYYTITTDPGTTYLIHPINPKGCFVLKPGQYIDCWKLDFHQGKKDHKCLRQCGPMTGYRDNDKDSLIELLPGREETGNSFGVNCHGANKNQDTKNVGPWSAGCQVHFRWSNKEDMISECEKFRTVTGNRFTYTLLDEADFKNYPQ